MPDLMQILEILATISGILCVYLQTREKILAWPFGLLSVSILVFVFYSSRLYSDVILHVIYIGLNIYGWWYWSANVDKTDHTPIQSLSRRMFIIWAFIIVLGAILWGFGMNAITNADLVYFDAFTTVGSLSAQYLLARKVIQNWIIWIIVDVVAVNVYVIKELYFTAFMFFVFLLLCIKGYRDWKRSLANQLQLS